MQANSVFRCERESGGCPKAGGVMQRLDEETCNGFAAMLLLPCTALEFGSVMAGQRALEPGQQLAISECFALASGQVEQCLDDLHHRLGIAGDTGNDLRTKTGLAGPEVIVEFHPVG